MYHFPIRDIMEYHQPAPKETFKHGLSHNLSSDEITKLKNILQEEKVEFFLIPSQSLRELVLQGTHPVLQTLNDGFKTGIMSGNTVVLSKRIVINLLENKLEEPYKTMVDMGEVRVREKEKPKTSGEIIIPPTNPRNT